MKDFADLQYPHSELTAAIIAAAVKVHEELRPGLSEKLYERAVCIEFADRALHFDQQLEYPVHYKNHFIGNLIPDLIVDKKVIVDLKVVDSFSETHIAQMMGYLHISGLKIGLLLNFKYTKIQIKRIVNPSKAKRLYSSSEISLREQQI